MIPKLLVCYTYKGKGYYLVTLLYMSHRRIP